MASITYDGQSFMLDGRRIWLVSGTIRYTRAPRAQWAELIHSAKLAGLNCITTDVVWARHEVRAGQFDFTGDNDIRHFVSLIEKAGLYCILRMGPYVGGGIDLGGIPPWLAAQADMKLRTNHGPFLEAASRFIGAVAKQVRDLQATAPIAEEAVEGEDAPRQPKAGPIILVQNENDWTCGSDDIAPGYLGELNRYLRESGFEVPIINSNNLWQGVEGEIDGWTGTGDMIANLRQLARVRGNQPRVVTEYRVGEQEYWGGPAAPAPSSDDLQRGLAEVLASAAQFNIEPLHGGTNLGFLGGRLAGGLDHYACTRSDEHAPIGESGVRGPLFPSVRRVGMFASRFARLLSHLDPRQQAATLHPGSVHSRAGARKGMLVSDQLAGAPVVVYASGTQGSIAFVFNGSRVTHDPKKPAEHTAAPVLLADGTVLPVYLGENPVAWCVLEMRLAGRSTLDYCNLSAFALVGSVFVCAGPAGTPARLSINGAPLELMVPEGEPEIIQHESILVVICRDEYLAQVQVLDEGVVLGAIDLDINSDPVIPRGAHGCTFLSAAGDVRELKIGPNIIKPPKVAVPPPAPAKGAAKKPVKKGKHSAPPPPPAEPKAIILPTVHAEQQHKSVHVPTLHHWTSCDAEAYLDGSSARYASIAGPADLTKLGAPFGYGWYRIALKNSGAGKVDVAWPECGDRLAMYVDGKAAGILGAGPGAEAVGSLNLRKGDQTLVVLAENLGRFSGGVTRADKRGLGTHAWSVKPLRTARPSLERGQPIDMLMAVSPLFNTAPGDSTDPSRLTWHIPGKRKTPVLVTFAGGPSRGLILVNDAPVGAFDPSGPRQLLIEQDKLGRQNNTLQLAVFGDAHAAEKQLAESVTLLDCEEPITGGAQWSFAKWEEPGAAAFTGKGGAGKGPAWFKATFTVTGTPTALRFDTHGLSKGQLYINGRHAGRYFTQTAKGHDVGPQTHLLLAAQLLHAGENTIVVFDEHGHSPGKTKLVQA